MNKNSLWIVEKCYDGHWAPLCLDSWHVDKSDAEEFMQKRLKSWPNESLRVAEYQRVEVDA